MSRAASEPVSYFYIAMSARGGRRYGVRQARSVGTLAETLRKESLLLLKWYALPTWATPESTLTLTDHAALNEQLAQLLSRGVPLVEALEVVGATVRPSAKARVLRMRELVSGGSSFADACRSVGGFDSVTIAVYRAAERTGDLAGAAKRLSETARRQLAIRGKALTLTMYPIIVMSICIVVSALMLMLVVPRIGEALVQANVKLPAYSKVTIAVGAWMRDHVAEIGVGIAVLLAAVIALRRPVGRGIGVVSRHIPGIKGVVLAQESARFFSVMAAMTRSGVPLAEALGTANQALTHPKLRAQLERLRERLVAGGLLRVLIDEVASLPLATRRLLVAADRAGDMETAFTTLAGDMADEVDRKSSRFLAALEPLLIVIMFGVIGTLLLSILLPILTAGQGIGR